tara:strand:- start:599 stop:1345 length:747 start_codon:yes stop_codon:yes gene_type:complete
MREILKGIFYIIKLPQFFFQLIKFSNFSLSEILKIKILPKLFYNKKKHPFDAHYLYHTAWASRILDKMKPEILHDFGSDLRFVTISSANTKIIHHNIQKPNINLENLEFKNTDLTDMQDIKNSSINFLSCMHVVEHIGLGRYGDNLDKDGSIKAINEIKRVLNYSGNLIFVVPVGKKNIYFNAHRVFSYDQIIEYFNELELIEFSLVDDDGYNTGLKINADPSLVSQNNYACGCFWFRKKALTNESKK